MPVNALKEYLDENHVEYITISHSRAYTAQRIAAVAHVPGKDMAKTVILKVDGSLVMAVLRAPDKVNLTKVKEVAGADKVELATEGEFEKRFKDCELGAMPPFGNLYNLSVLVDANLTKDAHIVFNACSHRELIRMPYASYEKLVQPMIADIAY